MLNDLSYYILLRNFRLGSGKQSTWRPNLTRGITFWKCVGAALDYSQWFLLSCPIILQKFCNKTSRTKVLQDTYIWYSIYKKATIFFPFREWYDRYQIILFLFIESKKLLFWKSFGSFLAKYFSVPSGSVFFWAWKSKTPPVQNPQTYHWKKMSLKSLNPSNVHKK